MAMNNFRAADMPNGESKPRKTATPEASESKTPSKGSDVHDSEKRNSPAKKPVNRAKSTATKTNVSEETKKSDEGDKPKTATETASTSGDGQEN